MDHIYLDFEDPMHLRAKVGLLHDLLSQEPGTAPVEQPANVALFTTEELQAELARREAAAPQTSDTASEPVKPRRGRPPKAATEPAPAPPAPAPQPEPEPVGAKPPAQPTEVEREQNDVVLDLPSSTEMQTLLGALFAHLREKSENPGKALQEIVQGETGSLTLKNAPQHLWPRLKQRLETEIKKHQKVAV